MIGIIPLAGPDIITHNGLKPLLPIDGIPLLLRTLGSRNWVRSGEMPSRNMIFIMQDDPRIAPLKDFINTHFPGARSVLLSNLSRGALCSALAGTSLISDFSKPIVVDLVDMIFDSDFSPTSLFKSNPSTVGILPYFESTSSKYSYLEVSNNKVIRTVEKQVISTQASAGTYFFKNLSTLLTASSDSVANSDRYAVNESLFLCPCFNGIISPNHQVIPIPVTNVLPISLQFHSEGTC